MKTIFIIVVCFTIFAVIGYAALRKDFPYDLRVVNLNGDLIIHNKTVWNERQLSVLVNSDTYKIIKGQNTLVVPNINKDKNYTLKVFRSDLMGRLFYKPFVIKSLNVPHKKELVVFIGASIGRDWNLEKLPERNETLKNYEIFYWPVYQFDKAKIIEHILKMSVKPKFLFFKECAVFFPRNEKESLSVVSGWIEKLSSKNINSFILHTFQVTKNHAYKHKGRNESIRLYNSLIREAEVKSMNLNQFLLAFESDFLDDKFAQKDGLHLSEEAYQVLDKKFSDFILRHK